MSLEPGSSYLINLDTSETGAGTHWTALRVSSSTTGFILYVDSMGFPPPASFTAHARKNGREILASDSKNQRMEDTADRSCGARSGLALYTMAHAADDFVAFCDVLAR